MTYLNLRLLKNDTLLQVLHMFRFWSDRSLFIVTKVKQENVFVGESRHVSWHASLEIWRRASLASTKETISNKSYDKK